MRRNNKVATKIHPTTIIQGDFFADDDVEIGPYCLIQGTVRLGKGTLVEGHVTLGSRYGQMTVGERNRFYPGAVIGGPPQDITYKNESTKLIIGDDNVFREFATANLATTKGDKETVIGNNNYMMAYTHIGHDCKIGNHVVIANDTHIGGHTVIEDHVNIGGVCAFNQNTIVGKGAFIAGSSVVNKDILPFSKAQGVYAVCRATNKIGLQRKGFSNEEVENIHRAMRFVIMSNDTIDEAIQKIQRECEMTENIEYFIRFIRSSKRGIAR